MYGRSALISSIISKARERIRGFYGISRTSDKIRDVVEWLLMDSKFMYGDINVEVWTWFSIKAIYLIVFLLRNIHMMLRNHLELLSLQRSLRVNGSPHHRDQMQMWPQQQGLWKRGSFLFLLLFLFSLWCVWFCLIQPELTFIIKIEHSLKEWSNGRKANKMAFTEDIAKQRFFFCNLVFFFLMSFLAMHII